MSILSDQIAALRANRERYVQSIANLDAKLEREKAKPDVNDPHGEAHLRLPRVEEYVKREKGKLTEAIVAIDDDLALLK